MAGWVVYCLAESCHSRASVQVEAVIAIDTIKYIDKTLANEQRQKLRCVHEFGHVYSSIGRRSSRRKDPADRDRRNAIVVNREDDSPADVCPVDIKEYDAQQTDTHRRHKERRSVNLRTPEDPA